MDVVNVYKTQAKSNRIKKLSIVNTRRASKNDLAHIYSIACSVGKKNKTSEDGFLMDNYASNPKYFQNFFMEKLLELEHFYIAENNQIVGFLMAYTKEQWLKYNPHWIEEICWRPNFDKTKLDNFVVIDKTAILANLTGNGIGSILYEGLIKDLKSKNINHIFSETIISPTPNFASLSFRKKQKYNLSGLRYEDYKGTLYTDLIYHKSVD
ncbi:GNAT family N-acetyltransferase [Marinisporobacter balticus]|uniref:Acetyltransferase (GNAT) family protein n=1 Tax=Marinisporobacter balticus TaxID=2018667 RepID=A0A4R2KS25_9FIRM|nr:GNAT family N-acetyltransferase [Marinisporobacter balticus]TCO73806.1 acetyltransferase (GNAT) family protein [Marinisporobacter balticus]